jgi:hypothetical protein
MAGHELFLGAQVLAARRGWLKLALDKSVSLNNYLVI